MKIFTHIFVIYHNGWVFKWEHKEPQKPFDIVKIIVFIVLYGTSFAHFAGVL